jgi:hypothetical protein
LTTVFDATPLLRAFARYRLNGLHTFDAATIQRRTLRKLVHRARNTRFGHDHGFSRIGDVADFQYRVPLRDFEEFWSGYWAGSFPNLVDVTWPGHIPYFALTSGTSSGRSKYIPVSREMLRSNRRAAVDIYAFHLRANPESRLLAGKSMMLSGSTQLTEEAPGVSSGDLSGIMAASVPWYARSRFFPPPDIGRIQDWEEKMALIAARSRQETIRVVGGTTSWLVLFLDQVLKNARGARLVDVYPDLDLLVHGGVSFEPYRTHVERLCAGMSTDVREVYPASEGFIAIADAGPDDGLRLCLDHGIFFEFVPVTDLESTAPRRYWIDDIEEGVDYAIAVTTCAGLWSYLVGDTVRFVDRANARIVVTGRTAQMLSAFGEHVIVSELDRAISAACRATECAVVDYAVGAVFPRDGHAKGHHVVVAEFESRQPDPDRFTALVDAALQEENDDYRAHRSGDFGVGRPQLVVGASGMFRSWMTARGKLGGQNKVPRILTDPQLLAELRTFAEDFTP